MHVVLLVAAVLCGAIAALLGFGVFSGSHLLGWLSLAVTFLAASALVAHVPWPARS